MGEQRKVVTILFADVVGSTDLAADRDPEVVRAEMGRYFKRVGEIANAYGGTVEKFAGDAAMVVFGVPTVHDDDAERAVRAALEIRDSVSGVEVRVGVNTGEAMTAITDDRQFMVSGDAVNIAARLQQGADVGEVLVDNLTYRLTRAAIEYEARDPVHAKGKAEPLVAHRAVRAVSDVPVQARGVPGLRAAMVGRNRELRLLLDTYARVAEDRTPHLFTLVGAAGVGKSRLAHEALATLAGSGARVLRGRCLPYGRGITYWPLNEILRQDTGVGLADERDTALIKLDRWLGELMDTDSIRPAVRARLAVMLGLEQAEIVMPDTPPEQVEKEIAWAMRQYIEAVGRPAPAIVVVDDMQWAEPPVLAIVEQLVERLTDVSLIAICIARPEFIESHPSWGSGVANSTTITLDSLNANETATLISRLLQLEALPSSLREQIIHRSGGTPLFCEEFIHMLIDEGRLVREGETWTSNVQVTDVQVPQTISAVVAARLDGLPENERRVLQAASVIGERFELQQVAAMVPDPAVESILESLRRKGLVGFGERSGDELRFRHLLIREGAYASLPKAERAALHDSFGSALQAEAGDPLQFVEILAHHSERAFTLSRELGIEGDPLKTRARRAVEWSLAMADRERARHDAKNLETALQTARAAMAGIPERESLDLRARLRLLEAQSMVIQADYIGAGRAAAEAASLGEQAHLKSLVATARLTEAWVWNWSGEGFIENFRRIVQRAIDACSEAGDRVGEIEARHVGSNIEFGLGRLDEFIEINQALLRLARSIGDELHAPLILERLAHVEQMRGNLEASDRYIAEAEELAARHGLRYIALQMLRSRGHRQLFSGEFDAALETYGRVIAECEAAGIVQIEIGVLRFMGMAFRSQRRYQEMVKVVERAIELSEATGERWNRAEILGLRARAALELGDLEGANRFIERALNVLRDEDVTGTCEVYDHLGEILAAEGREAEAEAAFRRSVDSVAGTDYVWVTGVANIDLAKFLAQRGRLGEARDAIEPFASKMTNRSHYLGEDGVREVLGLIEAEAHDT